MSVFKFISYKNTYLQIENYVYNKYVYDNKCKINGGFMKIKKITLSLWFLMPLAMISSDQEAIQSGQYMGAFKYGLPFLLKNPLFVEQGDPRNEVIRVQGVAVDMPLEQELPPSESKREMPKKVKKFLGSKNLANYLIKQINAVSAANGEDTKAQLEEIMLNVEEWIKSVINEKIITLDEECSGIDVSVKEHVAAVEACIRERIKTINQGIKQRLAQNLKFQKKQEDLERQKQKRKEQQAMQAELEKIQRQKEKEAAAMALVRQEEMQEAMAVANASLEKEQREKDERLAQLADEKRALAEEEERRRLKKAREKKRMCAAEAQGMQRVADELIQKNREIYDGQKALKSFCMKKSCLVGFERIKKYFDENQRSKIANIFKKYPGFVNNKIQLFEGDIAITLLERLCMSGELADIEWYFEEIKLVPEEHDCFMYLYSRLEPISVTSGLRTGRQETREKEFKDIANYLMLKEIPFILKGVLSKVHLLACSGILSEGIVSYIMQHLSRKTLDDAISENTQPDEKGNISFDGGTIAWLNRKWHLYHSDDQQ